MESLINALREPWPWYLTGPLVGLMIPLLLITCNRQFGISSSLRHVCAALLPTKAAYFHYEWKKDVWNLVIALGVMIGGFIAAHYFMPAEPVQVNPATAAHLRSLNIRDLTHLQPADLYSWHALMTVRGIIIILGGGFLVGFGTRYGNGCTSGHGLMGLSLESKASLAAVIAFYAGGIFAANVLLPFILRM